MSGKRRLWALLTVLLAAALLLPLVDRGTETTSQPAAWATKLDRPGLPNLHKINEGLYRGAQPTAEGIKELEKMGVKTIVNLRSNHSDKEILADANLIYKPIPMDTWDVVEDDIVRFLKIVTDKNCRPVFVHCKHGADRTGTMCAAYRVIVDGWTKQQAIDEMTDGGFGFHSIWTNLPKIIKKLDVQKLKDSIPASSSARTRAAVRGSPSPQ